MHYIALTSRVTASEKSERMEKEHMAYLKGLFPPLGRGAEAKQENIGQITW
jgi:hypothetical protein